MLICVLAYISDLFSTYDFLFPVDCFFFSYLEKTFQSFLSDMFSVQFSHTIMSNSLQPHGLQHARRPCPSPTPRACSNSCPSRRWCHSTISSHIYMDFCYFSCPRTLNNVALFFNFLMFFLIWNTSLIISLALFLWFQNISMKARHLFISTYFP